MQLSSLNLYFSQILLSCTLGLNHHGNSIRAGERKKGEVCPFIQFKKSTASMWRLTCILWEFLRRLYSISVSKALDERAAPGVEHYGMSRSGAQGGRDPCVPVCLWGADDSWEWETFAWATEQLWGGDPATVRPLTSCQPVTSTNRAHQSGLELIYKALEH